MLPTLCEGTFVERGDNVLAFGLPGRGKTHLVCAIGCELIQRGYRVLFTATSMGARLAFEIAKLAVDGEEALPSCSCAQASRSRWLTPPRDEESAPIFGDLEPRRLRSAHQRAARDAVGAVTRPSLDDRVAKLGG